MRVEGQGGSGAGWEGGGGAHAAVRGLWRRQERGPSPPPLCMGVGGGGGWRVRAGGCVVYVGEGNDVCNCRTGGRLSASAPAPGPPFASRRCRRSAPAWYVSGGSGFLAVSLLVELGHGDLATGIPWLRHMAYVHGTSTWPLCICRIAHPHGLCARTNQLTSAATWYYKHGKQRTLMRHACVHVRRGASSEVGNRRCQCHTRLCMQCDAMGKAILIW